MAKWGRRLAAAAVGIAAGSAVALMTGTAAYAHSHVAIQPAVAGASNATVTVEAAAESSNAGIAKVQVFLPAGLAPSAVTLKQAPAGWTLTPGADNYTVGGTALRQGVDAVHSVTVSQLPNSTRLVFKVLVTYSNGSIDRWIEEPTTANPNPENPAPVVQLSPAPTPPPTTAALTTAPATSSAATTGPTAAAPDDGGGNAWLWILGLVLIAAVAGVIALALRRRARPTP
jgi:hypothetical protein